MLAFIQAHGGVYALGIILFTIISIILGAIASIFVALGKQVPGGVGKAIEIVGNILHFLNGNMQAAKPADPKV